MKQTFAILFTLLTVPFAVAETALDSVKAFTPTDARLPKAIREKLTSVHPSIFKLVSISPEASSQLRPNEYADLIKRIGVSADRFAVRFLERVLEKCKSEGLEFCPFYNIPLDHFATAFLAENNSTVWTVRHAIQATLGKAKNAHLKNPRLKTVPFNPLSPALKVKIVLLDSEDNIVFDSTEASGQAELVTCKMGEPRVGEANPYLGAADDFIRIKLNRNLAGRPWEFARTAPRPEDTIYVAGFSGVAPDHLEISAGNGIATREALPNDIASEFLDRLEGLLTFTNADVKMRGSGGPWLNKDGQVVGLSVRSRTRDGEGAHFGTSPKLETLLKFVP